jgi:hypothetical protein
VEHGEKAGSDVPHEDGGFPSERMRAARGLALGIWLGIVLRLFARR